MVLVSVSQVIQFPRGTVRYPRAGPEWVQVAGDGYIYVTDRSNTPAVWVSHVRRYMPPAVIDFRQAGQGQGKANARQHKHSKAKQRTQRWVPSDCPGE